MKKLIFFFSIVIILSGCSIGNLGKQSVDTLSEIKILEKHHSNDWKSYWVICEDPNSQQQKKKNIRINIANKMVWNLIKVGTTYTADYEKKGNEDFNLNQIMYKDDAPKLLNREN